MYRSSSDFKLRLYEWSIPLTLNVYGNCRGKLRVRVYPRVGSVRVENFGAGRVLVRVASSATGTGRVAEMVDPHTPTAHPKRCVLWAAYPSFCLSVRLSVTLWYYVKIREPKRMQSLPPNITFPLVFWGQEWLMGDDPVQIKVECKEVDRCENSRAEHISPRNSGNVIDSENSSLNANKKSTMGFPTSHQRRYCVTPDFLKMVFRCPNFSFFSQKIRQKLLKVCLLSKNFQVCYKVSFCAKL